LGSWGVGEVGDLGVGEWEFRFAVCGIGEVGEVTGLGGPGIPGSGAGLYNAVGWRTPMAGPPASGAAAGEPVFDVRCGSSPVPSAWNERSIE